MASGSKLKIYLNNWIQCTYWWIHVGFWGITWPIILVYNTIKLEQEKIMAKQQNSTGKKSQSHGTFRAKRRPNSPKNKQS